MGLKSFVKKVGKKVGNFFDDVSAYAAPILGVAGNIIAPGVGGYLGTALGSAISGYGAADDAADAQAKYAQKAGESAGLAAAQVADLQGQAVDKITGAVGSATDNIIGAYGQATNQIIGAQQQAAGQTTNALWQMYQQSRADSMPYLGGGGDAMSRLTGQSYPTQDPAQYAPQNQTYATPQSQSVGVPQTLGAASTPKPPGQPRTPRTLGDYQAHGQPASNQLPTNTQTNPYSDRGGLVGGIAASIWDKENQTAPNQPAGDTIDSTVGNTINQSQAANDSAIGQQVPIQQFQLPQNQQTFQQVPSQQPQGGALLDGPQFQDFENSPYYQYGMEEQMRATDRFNASRGLYGSGKAAKDLQSAANFNVLGNYGNFVNDWLNTKLNPTLQVAQIGQNTAMNLGNQGITTAANVGNAYQNAANNVSNAYLSNASGAAGAYGNQGNILANTYGSAADTTSYAAMGAAGLQGAAYMSQGEARASGYLGKNEAITGGLNQAGSYLAGNPGTLAGIGSTIGSWFSPPPPVSGTNATQFNNTANFDPQWNPSWGLG